VYGLGLPSEFANTDLILTSTSTFRLDLLSDVRTGNLSESILKGGIFIFLTYTYDVSALLLNPKSPSASVNEKVSTGPCVGSRLLEYQISGDIFLNLISGTVLYLSFLQLKNPRAITANIKMYRIFVFYMSNLMIAGETRR
jgi:hypothetical protein